MRLITLLLPGRLAATHCARLLIVLFAIISVSIVTFLISTVLVSVIRIHHHSWNWLIYYLPSSMLHLRTNGDAQGTNVRSYVEIVAAFSAWEEIIIKVVDIGPDALFRVWLLLHVGIAQLCRVQYWCSNSVYPSVTLLRTGHYCALLNCFRTNQATAYPVEKSGALHELTCSCGSLA